MGLFSSLKCPFSGMGKQAVANRTGAVKIGWLVDSPSAGLIYQAPRRLKGEVKTKHAKSAARCPAVIDLEARYFEIPCPFDLHLKMVCNAEGNWGIRNLAGPESAIRSATLKKQVHMVSPSEWRDPARPMIQISAPYRFVTDEPVYITQCEPFMDYRTHAWPGLLFGGRFPVHLWPRSLMWAFEWHDTEKPLRLRRGDPWFYACFDYDNPGRKVRLVEAEMTPVLRDYTRQMDGVTNYVNQTYSLFERAAQVRPKTLLTERTERYMEAAE
ncbi:hypothetical protein [Aestuariispira insulae]|uniref:Uncharacterized protein n=1 Tax=Aestuariispira insulae TaxID=1461337 RepID=A0A3D9H2G1_9PROT|nr:hypothetical protein [Aestuariispira insulae]RED43351.1 hypothetical protein DFP90_1249 [Aestuariispira insulae]